MSNTKPSGGVWDASECALLLIESGGLLIRV
jgi:hypothetical protein